MCSCSYNRDRGGAAATAVTAVCSLFRLKLIFVLKMCQILTNRGRVHVLVRTRMCLYSHTYSDVLVLAQQRSSPGCSYCNGCVQLVPSCTQPMCSKRAYQGTRYFFFKKKWHFFGVIPRSFARPLHTIRLKRSSIVRTRARARMCFCSYTCSYALFLLVQQRFEPGLRLLLQPLVQLVSSIHSL